MNDKEVREKVEEGYILARMIIELAGYPKEHVIKTMDMMNEALEKIKEIKIVKLEKVEPTKAKEELI